MYKHFHPSLLLTNKSSKGKHRCPETRDKAVRVNCVGKSTFNSRLVSIRKATNHRGSQSKSMNSHSNDNGHQRFVEWKVFEWPYMKIMQLNMFLLQTDCLIKQECIIKTKLNSRVLWIKVKYKNSIHTENEINPNLTLSYSFEKNQFNWKKNP